MKNEVKERPILFMGAGFRKLWDSLNAKRGLGWDANPWTWVIEFEPLSLRA